MASKVYTASEMREGVVADGRMEQTLREFANRIEAAHKREMADEKRISDAVVQSLRDKKLEKDREVAEKDNEIARLRAALKPVLDLEDNYDGHWPFVSLAVGAVKEAQRIYKDVKK